MALAVGFTELPRTPDRNEVSSVEMRQAGTVKVNVTKHRGVGQGVIYVDVFSLRAFTTTMIDRITHTIYTRNPSIRIKCYGHFLMILMVRRVFNFRWSLNSHDVLYRVSPK